MPNSHSTYFISCQNEHLTFRNSWLSWKRNPSTIKLILFRPRNVVMYSDLTKYFILALLQQLIRYDALLGVIIVWGGGTIL